MGNNKALSTVATTFDVARTAAAQGEVAPVRLSVLLVDDAIAYQKFLHTLLLRRGHDVTFANNGEEALKLFNHADFDVVLMDIHMPIMNGFEAAQAIREHELVGQKHVPIIAVTTQDSASGKESSFMAGIDAYLPKPVDVAKLFELVETLGRPCGTTVPSTPPSLEQDEANVSETVDPRQVIDVASSLKRLGGDMDLFKEIVHIFDEDSPAILQSLKEAVAMRDGTNVEQFAHCLKGLTANFGARRAFDAADRLEELGRNSTWENVIQATMELQAELARLNAALHEFRTST